MMAALPTFLEEKRSFRHISGIILGISQTYIRHIPGIYKTYINYISGISPAYLRYILDISPAYLRHISGISQAYLRHISGISKAYLRHILDIFQVYLRDISGKSHFAAYIEFWVWWFLVRASAWLSTWSYLPVCLFQLAYWEVSLTLLQGVHKEMLNFSGYKHARRHNSFERWDPYLCLEYKNISVWYQGAEI